MKKNTPETPNSTETMQNVDDVNNGEAYRAIVRSKTASLDDLMSVVWYSYDEDLCREAIGQINSQIVLSLIALKHPNWFVRSAAVSKLRRQDMLFSIALHDPEDEVRCIAVMNLFDQSKLLKVLDAQWDNDRLAKIALNNIHRRSALKKIATDCRNPEIRLEAAERLKKKSRRHESD